MNKLLKPLELAIVGFGWVARAPLLALVLMVVGFMWRWPPRS